MLNDLTEAKLKNRLNESNVRGFITWNPETDESWPKDDATPEQYAEAKAVFDAVVAEGSVRYKSLQEFWQTFAPMPGSAQQCLVFWTAVIWFRELSIQQPELAREICANAGWQLGLVDRDAYELLTTNGVINFEATTTDAPQ